MSNGLGKNILVRDAKKAYKLGSKGVSKKNRMPFAQFLKKYCEAKMAETKAKEPEQMEDFDLSTVASMNELEEPQPVEKVEESKETEALCETIEDKLE